MSFVEYREFNSEADNRKFTMPYIVPPKIQLNEEKSFGMNFDSELKLKDFYNELSLSDFKSNGVGIIFGTFDNFHVGHQSMLNTARALCSELYVGIEDKQRALVRKNYKHPIQENSLRQQQIIKTGICDSDHVFIRKDAVFNIKLLQLKGIKLSILFVGESQKDNVEMVNAVEYCRQKGIQVVAIDRLRTHDRSREISSSQIHKIKSERGNE